MLKLSGAFGINMLVSSGSRYAFDNRLNIDLPIVHGKARCHSISYMTISIGISTPINYCIQGIITIATCGNCLQGLCNAVFGGQIPLPGTNAGIIYNAAWAHENKLIGELQTQPQNYNDILDSANNLLYCLNSCLYNLRYGSESWNSSIGEAFDPECWAHTDAQGNFDSCHLGPGAGQPPNFPAVAVSPNSYYIYSASDNVRLDELENHTIGDTFYLYKAMSTTGMKFLYSSSNTFAIPFPSADDYDTAYYLDTATNAWVSF
jgi:hypothetical protein